MEEPEQVPAPRPQRRIGKRLLTVGLAGLLVVAATAVARADAMDRFLSGQSSQHLSNASSTGAKVESSSGDGSHLSGASSFGITDHGSTWGNMGTYQGHGIFLPRDVAPPPGSRVTTILRGSGVLVFTCTAGVFRPTEPAQNLFALNGALVGIHFGPPSWESTRDGSRVDAVPVKVTQVRRAAPRVLFRALNVHGGQGMFGRTAFIIQLPLTGGVAPATCTVPGKRIGVPFQSLYLFFRSTTGTTLPSTTTTLPPMTPAAGGTTLYGTHW